MRRALAAMALAALSAAALPKDEPKGSIYDSRIQHVMYNELDVVQVNAGVGYATQIVFGKDEEVVPNGIASGFSAGWQIQDAKNNVYLKPQSVKGANGMVQPTAKQWNTNLIIVTNKRQYSFVLALHEEASPKIAFRVVFSYPGDADMAAREETDRRAVQQKLNARAAPRNWQYTMHVAPGSSEIAPTMAYDDGRFTYLRFPGNREIPAVFHVAENKTESAVNTHINPETPDVLVVQRVSRQMMLRYGQMVVGIYNESYEPQGVPPQGGTAIPGVRRRVKGESPLNTVADDGVTAAGSLPQGIHGNAGGADPRGQYLPPGWDPDKPIAPAHPPIGEDND
ncbi:MAG: P-type conjugative transfer protein VirB9 [Azoarcus sp.]|jgi:P-type conjugative transfer protein VirB9|nr:P-type conjugative transfer protein VirB9 [Azoarcus sp.]